MNDDQRKKIEQKTEESKQQAIQEAIGEHENNHDDKTIHTINPFTGVQMDITPDDLEGIEKKHEADTERD